MAAARAQLDSFVTAFDHPASTPTDADAEWRRLVDALEDDFNTPQALSILHEWRVARFHDLAERALAIFGIAQPQSVLVGTGAGYTVRSRSTVHPSDEILGLVQRRDEARARKDWGVADALRDELKKLHWSIEDEAGGYFLKRT